MFTPYKSTAIVCSWECANIYAKELNEKKTQKEWKERKAKLKSELMTLSDWLKIAQTHFNEYIRLRDKDKGCISCGKELKKGNTDAGHYMSSGGHYNVRFNEDNVHGQCSRPCNKDKSGDLLNYRKGLINRIGLERLEHLESISNITRKFTINEVKEIAEVYKEKVRIIKKSLEK
jgi:hypothetical protein